MDGELAALEPEPQVLLEAEQLAHALGLQAIAEGVECEEQLASIRELGCDLAQGFLLARPMEPARVRDLLDAPVADWR